MRLSCLAFVFVAMVIGLPRLSLGWSLISVPRNSATLELLEALPVLIEGGDQERLHVEAKVDEIQTLQEWGIDVRILVTDLQTLRPISSSNAPLWLSPDSGEYHNEDQIILSLLELGSAFPSISRVIEIGTSVEGRVIAGVLLSDKPWVREFDEPSFRIIGGQHGNEWASTEVTLAAAWHFAENYTTDPLVQGFLDSSELWIIPALNPDGMSHFTRNNANNVDLNRNFSFAWRETAYSGNAPFSEPETSAVRNLGMVRVFSHSLSVHSGAANLGWVWNHTTDRCPDDDWMQGVSARYLQATNHPDFWITNGADWYVIYGDTNDWSYGERGGQDYTLEVSEIKTPPESSLDSLLGYHLVPIENFFVKDGVKGIRGRVRDQNGNGIEATIRIVDETTFVYSDYETGAYHRPLPQGNYLLEVASHGFDTRLEEVIVEETGQTILDFELRASVVAQNEVSITGREQLANSAGTVSICGVAGVDMSWAIYRASIGLFNMGELTRDGDCWKGHWDPAVLVQPWEREGEWTLFVVNSQEEVIARSSAGLVIVKSIGNPRWGLRLESAGFLPEFVSVESEVGLKRIVLSGDSVPLGASLRLIHTDGYRSVPIFQSIDEAGNSYWLVNSLRMEEGLWSLRVFGAGEWTVLPVALEVSGGELFQTMPNLPETAPSFPEIDLQLDFEFSQSEEDSSNIQAESGCDCSGSASSALTCFFCTYFWFLRPRRLTR